MKKRLHFVKSLCSRTLGIGLILLAMGAFTACSDDDGDWPPMKWKTEAFFDKSFKISAPATGGTYTLTCTNYSPWISHIEIGGNMYTHIYNDSPIVNADWLSAGPEEKGKIVIEVSPNTSGAERTAKITLTAGDIFGVFTVVQAAE